MFIPCPILLERQLRPQRGRHRAPPLHLLRPPEPEPHPKHRRYLGVGCGCRMGSCSSPVFFVIVALSIMQSTYHITLPSKTIFHYRSYFSRSNFHRSNRRMNKPLQQEYESTGDKYSPSTD